MIRFIDIGRQIALDEKDDAAEDEADADDLQARLAPRLIAAIADPNGVPEGAGRTFLLEAAAARYGAGVAPMVADIQALLKS